jgi:hypothetical protein
MRRAPLLAALGVCAVLSGCLLPRGTPVIVEARTGRYWSGNGVLLEVSEDQRDCRVAVRNAGLIVEKKWVACAWVHLRSARK